MRRFSTILLYVTIAFLLLWQLPGATISLS